MLFIILVCSVPVVAIATCGILYFIEKRKERKNLFQDPDTIPLKFAQFKAFYDTNPSAWRIEENYYPRYRKPGTCSWKRDGYKIVFSYLDFKKYNKWIKTKKEKEREIAKYKAFADALGGWREDARTCEERAQNELEKARTELEKIQKRLLEDK